MPCVGEEDVEEPHRRQDGAGEPLLNLDEAVDDIGIVPEPLFDHAIDVGTIEILIEPDAGESRSGVHPSKSMQRRACTVEKRGRQPKKNADCQNETEPNQKKGTRTRKLRWHGQESSNSRATQSSGPRIGSALAF